MGLFCIHTSWLSTFTRIPNAGILSPFGKTHLQICISLNLLSLIQEFGILKTFNCAAELVFCALNGHQAFVESFFPPKFEEIMYLGTSRCLKTLGNFFY